MLVVRPMTEADLYDWEVMTYDSFAATGDQLTACLWPAGRPTEEGFRKAAADRLPLLNEPSQYLICVADTELNNKAIACSHWTIYETERTTEELDKIFTVTVPPGVNSDAWMAFFTQLYAMRRQYTGSKPHVLLKLLATHPDHHRRGAGRMLLEWGAKSADERGYESFLEATSVGRPLYERCGYKAMEEKPFDAGKYGGTGVIYHTVS
jgi:GNAT superfamily N-acetyltransferase